MKPMKTQINSVASRCTKNPACPNIGTRLLAKAIPAFAAGLFAILSAAPSHAATIAHPVVATGGSHSLFVKSDGTLQATGYNYYGQLGDNTNTTRASPVQVCDSSGVPATNVIAVAAGSFHSLFVKNDGTLWAMGYNYYGQLGDGTTTSRTSVVQVKDSSGVPVTNVIAVAAGDAHSLFVKSDGTLWAMGYNYYGQLGDGTTTSRTSPVQVKDSSGTPVTNVITVAAGDAHSLFVKSDGTLWAMGNNSYGQLGDGTTINRTSPVQVTVDSLGVPVTNIIAVAAGGDHSLFVKSDGTLWAMGNNNSGQLGDGTATVRSSPVQVRDSSGVPATNVIAVAASGGCYYNGLNAYIDSGHSLFVKSDGTLWAMGYNNYGQLGDGTTTNRYNPVQVTVDSSGAPVTDVIAVAAAGGYYSNGSTYIYSGQSLFVKSDGTLWAMGNNNYGQLGDGTTTIRTKPEQVNTGLADTTPLTIFTITFDAQGGSISPTTQIAVPNHPYATLPTLPTPTRDGYTFDGWWTGSNGTGDNVLATTTFTATNDETLYAKWTVSSYTVTFDPQGGSVTPDTTTVIFDQSYGTLPEPTRDGCTFDGWWTGTNGTGDQVLATTTVITPNDHTLYAKWTGNPHTVTFDAQGGSVTPASVTVTFTQPYGTLPTPSLRAGYIFGGWWTALDGTGTQITASTVVTTPNNHTLYAKWIPPLAAGGFHSLYVTDNGNLADMGYNNYGQLGDGTTTNHNSPVQVTVDSSGAPVTGIIAVAAGSYHSLFVKSDGTLWAMGANTYGQLGDNTNTTRTSPVQVRDSSGAPVTDVIAVAAGGYSYNTSIYGHSLFVKSDGTLWAMGANNYGQLGDGTTTNRASIVQVKDSSGVPVTNVIAVAAGDAHSLFVKSDGTLWAMGNNNDGQLGDGTTTNRTSLVQVRDSSGVPVTNVIAVAAGFSHSLFVKSDGTLWAMGYNLYGQLGVGTNGADYTHPVQVTVDSLGVPVTDVIAVAAGPAHNLFVKSDGTLWAMGYNYYGQLGDTTTTTRYAPVQVRDSSGTPVTNVIAVAAGGCYIYANGSNYYYYGHSLFVKNDGTLWAMGDNDYGQLGDRTTTARTSPVIVASRLAPTVTSVSPSTAKAGDPITIIGTNLAGATVTIGGATATIGSNDGTTLKVTVPASATSGTIVATTAAGPVTATQTLTITPTITGVSPLTAIAGATTITIIGTNLTGATVTIGGATATIVSNDGTTLKVTVPASATSGTIVITPVAGPSVTATQTLTTITPAALTVDKFTLALAQNAGATATFAITSNVSWTTSIDPATATWLTVSPKAGTGNTTATVTAASTNSNGTPRFASIVVDGDGITRTLIATQDATSVNGLAPAAPLPVGAILTLTTTNGTRAYTVATSYASYANYTGTLTTTDTTGPLTLVYEYNATGNTGTLIIPDLDSVYSLQFANATSGTLILYTFDDDGPYELNGSFTYTAPTYNLTLNSATATPVGPYAAGTTITITADPAPSGQVFDCWTSYDSVAFANSSDATTTFSMPANDVTITAIYTPTSSGGGGGGGGGAPSMPWLAALAALLALRAKRRYDSYAGLLVASGHNQSQPKHHPKTTAQK